MAAGHDLKSTHHFKANVPETKHTFDGTLENKTFKMEKKQNKKQNKRSIARLFMM